MLRQIPALEFAIRAFLVGLSLLTAQANPAQSPKPTPDTVVFTNGEQLTGTLEKADGKGITFKSAMAGEITVPWANIQELRSDKDFAVLTAGQRLTRRNAAAIVPQGRISVQTDGKNKQLAIETTGGPRTIPVGEADRLIDAAGFDKAVLHPPRLWQGWGGTATGGVSLVRSTQDSTTFTGAVALIRSTPTVDWLPPRSRSNVDYTQSYGTTVEVGQPTIQTNIFHAEAERDDYFSSRLFEFVSTTFDHNFAQSLNLQQAYGVGVGMTLVKNTRHELNVKGDLHYEKEGFFDPTQNQNLAGSTFSERYMRNLRHSIVVNEFASVSPSWNNTKAYSAHANAGMTFPILKALGFNLGAVEDYLNNAPIGSKRNSTQFTSGVTYTIRPR